MCRGDSIKNSIVIPFLTKKTALTLKYVNYTTIYIFSSFYSQNRGNLFQI